MRKLLLFLLLISFPFLSFADSETTIGGKTAQSHIIQNNGVSLRPRPYLNFTTGLTCSDVNGKTECAGLPGYNDTDAQNATGWIKSGSNVYLHTITDSVGIGTSTPSEKLEVEGTSHISGISQFGSKTLDVDVELDYIEYANDTLARENYVTDGLSVIGTGGTITDVGNDKIHTFLSSGTFSLNIPTIVWLVAVGAGGSGYHTGTYFSGGGGAGGYIEDKEYPMSAGDNAIYIGQPVDDANGENTTLNSTELIAYGGGRSGASGGSGGGAFADGGSYGNGTVGQGNRGGISAHSASGGGGGAGAVGQNAPSTGTGGAGGIGKASDISGSSVYRAGGGGGSGYRYGTSAGGLGGGGRGYIQYIGQSCQNGADNSGGGAGGGFSICLGGSGVFIIRYTSISPFQSNKEDTIKTQGSYSIKLISTQNNGLGKKITKIFNPPVDKLGSNEILFDFRASRTGSNFSIKFEDSKGNTKSINLNVDVADAFQRFSLSSIGLADIEKIVIEVINADEETTAYIDNIFFRNKMVIIDSGKVGIGTLSPSKELDVVGEGKFSVSIDTPSISNLTDNGFVKTSGSNGTLGVDTNTYLTAESDTLATVTARGATTFENIGIGTSSPNSQLEIGGSFSSMVDIVSSDLTLDATHHKVIVTNTATITLPTAVGITGREYNIINGMVGIGTVTISTTGGQTIRGDASLEMYDRGSVVVISDGSNWERGS